MRNILIKRLLKKKKPIKKQNKPFDKFIFNFLIKK